MLRYAEDRLATVPTDELTSDVGAAVIDDYLNMPDHVLAAVVHTAHAYVRSHSIAGTAGRSSSERI